MKSFKKHLQGILLVTLGVALYLSGTVQAAQPGAPLRYTPTSTLGAQSRLLAGSELDDIRHPGLPDTLRVLAIRVDFLPDTLSTTTGDGSFFYELPDTVEAEDWLIDPPPHDKAYFEDQFLGLKLYYERFSHGKVTVVGDIYPEANEAAYRMPYPIWHINYGDTTDAGYERLNQKLTQLFIDSWLAADEDLVAAGVDYSQYDYFVIFHAGAGNEFDTGYDTTPHDIPSVYIGPQDLLEYSDYPNGVELGNSFRLDRGVILPEMQRQGDVEVGLLGTICAQVGFLMGMPHLYQAETGDPGIGLFGLMDRGFGGFFGIIPTPPSAWMRYYMGWEDAVEITDGPIRLGVLQLPDSVFHDSLHRLVKVPINEDEYYLLEARRRDPQAEGQVWYDSTYALDPDGDTLVLRYDYSFDLLHEGTGFGVPIWIEDQDFDLPASGILIWHIDERLIRAGLANDRVQISKDQRGVKLIEADGSWDIGEEYPFLTAGDGSEYGVIDDAFFDGNEVWPEANPGRGHYIYFGSETAPATVTTAGQQTHILFDNFTDIADTMRCRVGNEWKQGDFPQELTVASNDGFKPLPCDVDADGINEILFASKMSNSYLFDGDGNAIDTLVPNANMPRVDIWRTADITDDGYDEIIALSTDYLLVSNYNPSQPAGRSGVTVNLPWNASDYTLDQAIIVGPENSPHIVAKFPQELDATGIISITLPLPQLEPDTAHFSISSTGAERSYRYRLAQVGSEWSDTVAVLTENGDLHLFSASSGDIIRTTEAPAPHSTSTTAVRALISADFDGDGAWDLAGLHGHTLTFWFASESYNQCHQFDVERSFQKIIPLDIDYDGVVEVVGVSNDKAIGFEATGIIAEGSGIHQATRYSSLYSWNLYWIDASGRGENILFSQAMAHNSEIDDWTKILDAHDLNTKREVSGFPIRGMEDTISGFENYNRIVLTQLDDDNSPELVMVAENKPSIQVYNVPLFAQYSPIIHWGMEGGNAQGTYSLRTTPAAGSSRTGLDASAYCWPNPVLNGDDAHFRFRAKSGGSASVRIFDMVGREMMYKEQSIQASLDEEIVLSTRDLASGVYAARLEAGGEYKIIRFAVVK